MKWLSAFIEAIAGLLRRGASALPPASDTDVLPFTAEQMERAIIAVSNGRAPNPPEIVAALRAALVRYNVLSPLAIAHLIAQLAHESGGFRFVREVWTNSPAQQRYEGNRNLGNTQPGDGRLFAGMFWIQLTGRYNHQAYADYRGISIAQLHASVDDVYTSADVSVWYIAVQRPGFIAAAERNDLLAASIAVNGVNRDTKLPNGWVDRQRCFRVIAPILGVPA